MTRTRPPRPGPTASRRPRVRRSSCWPRAAICTDRPWSPGSLPGTLPAFDVTVAFPATVRLSPSPPIRGAQVLVLPDYAFRTRVLGPLRFLAGCAVRGAATRTSDQHAPASTVRRIYSNTINNGLGPVLRTLWRIPNVLHVHECPAQRPAFLKGVLFLAERTSDSVVFNSEYTRTLVRQYPAGICRSVASSCTSVSICRRFDLATAA